APGGASGDAAAAPRGTATPGGPDGAAPVVGARRSGGPGRAAARARGGCGVEYLGPGGADHPDADRQSAPAGPAAPAVRPTPTAASSPGSHPTRTLPAHHQRTIRPKGACPLSRVVETPGT